MSRRNFDPERRLQRDLGRAKDALREAFEVIALQARVIAAAGLEVPELAERRRAVVGASEPESTDPGYRDGIGWSGAHRSSPQDDQETS